jgi:DNA-directed RNA polymerase
MMDSGVARFFATIKRAKNSPYDGESTTTYGVSMLRYYVDTVAYIVRKSIKLYKGKPGKTPVAWEYLDGTDHRLVAYIASKSIIDAISTTVPLTATAIKIANKVEDNLRLDMLRKLDAKYMRSTQNYIKEQHKTDRSVMRNLLLSSFEKSERTPEWKPWPGKDKVHIGTALIQAFVHATSDLDNNNRPIPGTGLVQVVSTWKHKTKSQYFISGTDKAAEWIRANLDICKNLAPDFWPCVEPPISWESPTYGGYHTEVVRDRKPLVKTQKRKYLKRVPGEDSMPLVYKTANILQAVPWEVNTIVYNQMRKEFTRKDGVDMPSTEPIDIPRCPLEPLDTTGLTKEQARKAKVKARKNLTLAEKIKYAEWHATYLRLSAEERSRISTCLQISRTLSMANQMNAEEQYYTVWTQDFRGRYYAACTALSQQGTEKSKALGKFRRGVRLGKHGFKHLCLHAAGTYGIDKCSLDERLIWVEENREAIIATYYDPDDTREFWGRADKPYTFLSICMELGECIQLSSDERQDFVSHLPVPKDGKCNGIQHFSAMLCDTVSADAVCLSDSEVPQDIYQNTADKVLEYLQKTVASEKRSGRGYKIGNNGWEPCGKFDVSMAKAWLEFGVCRKLTKKPTMVLPYGGTKIACRDQVADYINEIQEGRKQESADYVNPLGTVEVPEDAEGIAADPIKYASAFLTNYVWAALDEVVVASRKAMTFLQEIAAVINTEDPGVISWTTPTGFKVMTDIRDTKDTLIKTFLDGQIRLSFKEELEAFDKYKMKSSLAPNFVHSIDSSHLQMAVCSGFDAGIRDFAVVHDSFAVHAGNCELFDRIIRATFRELHRDSLLVDFWRQQVKQRPHLKDKFPNPADVKRGDFDLDQVLTSTHFFG